MTPLEKATAEATKLRQNCATLESEIAKAGETLTELRKARREHAFSASMGEATAKIALGQTMETEEAIERRLANSEFALGEGRIRLAAAERNVADAEADERLAEGQRIAQEIIAASADVDQAAIALVAKLQKRQALARALTKTGTLPPQLRNRFELVGPINRALDAAGLSAFSEVPTRVAARSSLADHDKSVLGCLRKPGEMSHGEGNHHPQNSNASAE
jgi:hypothetical protein